MQPPTAWGGADCPAYRFGHPSFADNLAYEAMSPLVRERILQEFHHLVADSTWTSTKTEGPADAMVAIRCTGPIEQRLGQVEPATLGFGTTEARAGLMAMWRIL